MPTLTEPKQRIEPLGWDGQDRTYFLLDDNRLYRLTEPPPPPPKPKKNTKKAKAALRASKRRRVLAAPNTDINDDSGETSDAPAAAPAGLEDDGLGGLKWECVAVTLDDVRQFLSAAKHAKDPDEMSLRDRIELHLLPILERQEASVKRKQQQREKELLSLEKMTHAKRSSRIADRAEQRKAEEQVRGEEQKRREEEEAARKEEQKRLRMERQRDNRLMSREQRLQERDARRRQHQEELAQLSKDSQSLEAGAPGRMSERRIQAEIEKRKKILKEIEEEEDWMFDCVCGVRGHIDDGTHSVACDRCNVWQHSKCLGIDEMEAEEENFHFVCGSCHRREQAKKEQRSRMIKIKVNRPGPPSSPPTQGSLEEDDFPPPQLTPTPAPEKQLVVELQSHPSANTKSPPPPTESGNDEKTPRGSAAVSLESSQLSSHYRPLAVPSASTPSTATDPRNLQTPFVQGANPFSLPHPTLSPPDQSPGKSKAYHTIRDQTNSEITNGHSGTSARSPLVVQPSTTNLNGYPPGGAPPPLSVTRVSAIPTSQASPSEHTTKAGIPTLLPPRSPETATLPAYSLDTTSESSSRVGSQLTPAQRREKVPEERTTPLPSSQGGLSPIKHSPAPSQSQTQSHGQSQPRQLNGISPPDGMSSSLTHTSPKPTILPPTAALSPSPPQQILTPPVKHAEPARPNLPQPHHQMQQDPQG